MACACLRLSAIVTIEFTALSLVAPENVHFRYRLEGHDNEWQEAGDRRQAFYTNLTPGSYRFHVMASNNSGVWNKEGALLEFSIAPAFYQTNWFRLACAVVFLALLWTVFNSKRTGAARREAASGRDRGNTDDGILRSSGWFARPGKPALAGLHRIVGDDSADERGWKAAIHPIDAENLNKWRTAFASGEPFENEARHRSATGEYRWFLVRAVPLRDKHGKIVKWYGVLTDIEERKRAEEERERLRRMEVRTGAHKSGEHAR